MAISPQTGRREERRRFTVEEYHRMADSGILTEDDRVELIDGEVIEMAPIGSAHAAHVRHLDRLLHERLEDQAIVSVQNPLRLGDRSEPEPDIALLEPRDDAYLNAHPTAADVYLVVEVAETSLEYDRETKLPLYAAHGVPVVWLVDLRAGRVELCDQPADGEYRRIRRPTGDEELAVPPAEGVTLTPDELLL